MKNEVVGVFWFDRSLLQQKTARQRESFVNHTHTPIIAVFREKFLACAPPYVN